MEPEFVVLVNRKKKATTKAELELFSREVKTSTILLIYSTAKPRFSIKIITGTHRKSPTITSAQQSID